MTWNPANMVFDGKLHQCFFFFFFFFLSGTSATRSARLAIGRVNQLSDMTATGTQTTISRHQACPSRCRSGTGS